MEASSAGAISVLQEMSDSSSDLSEHFDDVAQSSSTASWGHHESCDPRRCPICSTFRHLISRYVQVEGIPQSCKFWPLYNLFGCFGEVFNFYYDEVNTRGVAYVSYHKQTSVLRMLRTEIKIDGKTLNVKQVRPGSDEFNHIFRRRNSSDLPPFTSASVSKKNPLSESQWQGNVSNQTDSSKLEAGSISRCCSSDEYDVMAGSTVDSKSEMSAHGADSAPLARRFSICVRQLPLRSSDSSIKEGLYFNFKKYGKVVAVKVIGSGDDRYALVSFRREVDARSAVAKCGQDRFFGRRIVAELAPEDMDGDDNERRPLEKDIDQYHPKSSRTLYVGNLWNGITPEVLKEQFSAYGTVLDIEIKNKETPAPFCFIQYADINSVVNAVLALEIDGYVGKNKVKGMRWIIRMASLKPSSILQMSLPLTVGFGKPLPTPTVWIDGLQPDITEAYLTRKMNFYGAIKDVLIDRTSGQALVTYDGVEAATNAVQDMKGRTIDNQRVRIDFCSRELHDLMVDRMYGTKQLDSSDNQIKPSKQIQQALQDIQAELCSKAGPPEERKKKKRQHNRESSISSDDSRDSEQRSNVSTKPMEHFWNVLQSAAAAHQNFGEDGAQETSLKLFPPNFQPPPEILKYYSACASAAGLIPPVPAAVGSDAGTKPIPVQESAKESASSTSPLETTSPETAGPPELRPSSGDESSPSVSDQQTATEKLPEEPPVEQADDAAKDGPKSPQPHTESESPSLHKEKSPTLPTEFVKEERNASTVHAPAVLEEKEPLGEENSNSPVPSGPLWVIPGVFQRIPVITTELCPEPRETPILKRRTQSEPKDYILPEFVFTMVHKIIASSKRQREAAESGYAVAESEEEKESAKAYRFTTHRGRVARQKEQNEAPASAERRLEELNRAMVSIEESTEKMVNEHIQYRRDVLSSLNAELLRTGVRSPLGEEEPPEFMVNLAKQLDGSQPPVPLKKFCEKAGDFFLNIMEQTASALTSRIPVQSRCRTYEIHGDANADPNDWTAKIAQLKRKFYTAQALSRVNDNWNKEMSESQLPDQQLAMVEQARSKSAESAAIPEQYEQLDQPPSAEDDPRKGEEKSGDSVNVCTDTVISVPPAGPLDREENILMSVASSATQAGTSKAHKRRSRSRRIYMSDDSSSSDQCAGGADENSKKRSLEVEETEQHPKGDQPKKALQRYFTYNQSSQKKRRKLSVVSDSDQSESPSDVCESTKASLPLSNIPSDVAEPDVPSLPSPEEESRTPKPPPCYNVVLDVHPLDNEGSPLIESPVYVETANVPESAGEQSSTALETSRTEAPEDVTAEGSQATLEVQETDLPACSQAVESISEGANDTEPPGEPEPEEATVSPVVIEENPKGDTASVCDLVGPVTPSQDEPVTLVQSAPANLGDGAPALAVSSSALTAASQQVTVSTFAPSSVPENFAATDVRQSLLAQAASQFPISFGDAGNVGAPWSQPMAMPQLLPRPGFMDHQFAPSGAILSPGLSYPFVRLQQTPFSSPIFPMDQTRLMANFSPFAAAPPRPAVGASSNVPFMCTVHMSIDDILYAEVSRNMAALGPRSMQFHFDRVQNPLLVLIMSYLPYANQDSNCRIAIMELCSRHPLVWDGILSFRRHELCVQLFHISGNVTAGPVGLATVAENSNGRALLRVAQRVVFNEETMKTMIARNGTFLLCLIGGAPISQMASQWQVMKEYLCNYLAEKAASGIIVNQQQEIAVTISPPTPFVRTYIQQKANGIYDVLTRSEIPFLFAGVTKYA